MLPKNQRLNLKKDFKWVAAGSSISDSLVKAFYRSGNNLTPLVGIALSKSNFKTAVERNRARRLTSSAMETIYNKLSKNINLVLMPKSDILQTKSNDVLADLEKLLSKNNLIEEDKN